MAYWPRKEMLSKGRDSMQVLCDSHWKVRIPGGKIKAHETPLTPGGPGTVPAGTVPGSWSDNLDGGQRQPPHLPVDKPDLAPLSDGVEELDFHPLVEDEEIGTLGIRSALDRH